ncbi:uncharacterized protein [Paramisgurnus dabryanus]|uniref:uncharacterized protein isoform X2 n=1 Tax=Paramisgurnus dabryanus TaxID=90735 RepID=UPI003CCF750B
MKHKEETIKQRAFFQKQRMKKFKKVDPQTSPNENNAANVDLLTLFIVNQIASKKKHNGKPKINFFNANETKPTLNETLELPMSPCSPSNLDLVTSQPQYSAHDSDTVDTPGFNIRKHCVSKEFKFKPLSPLLESNLSGSENQPHIQNTISPFPPTTGSSESFQPGPASHVSSSLPCRENSDPNTTKFELFSQPMTSANPWTDVSDDANGLQNSSVADILFGITLPNTDTAGQSAYSGLYPTSPLKSSEQLEEPLFIDFTNKDHKENPYAEKTTNIFLETSFSSSTRVQIKQMMGMVKKMGQQSRMQRRKRQMFLLCPAVMSQYSVHLFRQAPSTATLFPLVIIKPAAVPLGGNLFISMKCHLGQQQQKRRRRHIQSNERTENRATVGMQSEREV